MFNLKKITALLCTAAMLAAVSGCSSENESSAVDDVSIDEVSDSETSATEESAAEGNTSLDTAASMGSMNYYYNSDWIMSEIDSQVSFQLADGSGALIVQLTDGADMDAEDEDAVVEQLADQSETAWSAVDGMEILNSSWNEEMIPGKKCYVIEYSYEISSVMTTNTSIFFANFTDDSKDLFAVTATALTEFSTVDLSLEALLSTISFAE